MTLSTHADKALYWKQIFEDWKLSGLSRKAFCEIQNISFAIFAYWHKKINPKEEQASPQILPITGGASIEMDTLNDIVLLEAQQRAEELRREKEELQKKCKIAKAKLKALTREKTRLAQQAEGARPAELEPYAIFMATTSTSSSKWTRFTEGADAE